MIMLTPLPANWISLESHIYAVGGAMREAEVSFAVLTQRRSTNDRKFLLPYCLLGGIEGYELTPQAFLRKSGVPGRIRY